MLVDRRIFVAKPFMGGELKEKFIELFESNPWPGGNVRIYTELVSSFDRVIVETESENMAAYEKANAQFGQNMPEGTVDKFRELFGASGTHEMWTLAYAHSKD